MADRKHGGPAKRADQQDGIADDWGKTRPFWCLNCGRGYRSVERVMAHYSEAGHGNESMSVGSRGLTRKQQMEAFRLRNR
jgi:hypothetical protein